MKKKGYKPIIFWQDMTKTRLRDLNLKLVGNNA